MCICLNYRSAEDGDDMREIAQLEIKRERLHQYIIDKLEERDYHAIADAAMAP